MNATVRRLAPRVLSTLLTLWGLATAMFLINQLIPGDQAAAAAGRDASPEQIEAVRIRLGLDRPVWEQYVLHLDRLVHGDFGTSTVTLQPVLTDLGRLLPSSVELVVAAMVFALVAGSVPALFDASRGRPAGGVMLRLTAVTAGGVPAFWLAFLLQYLLGTRLGWFPVAGRLSPGLDVPTVTGMTTVDAVLSGSPTAVSDALAHLMLPAVVLGLAPAAALFRTLRTSLATELSQDYVVVARSKGASMRQILVRHSLRNAAIPSLSLVGLQVGWAFAGVVLVESVFTRQGIGSYLVTAVQQKDSQAAFGTVMFTGLIVVVVNLLVDIGQSVLDPRIRRVRLAAA
ncbi:ABC transporter permease [Streptomyces sp. NPDC055692]|uniref:ABC transporter permease n=1 Tax=Streptomyces sp. NPDC055692 TaxID=3155683 RepID=UPI00341EC6F8